MNKHPPDHYSPAGLEWVILKKLPAVLAWGVFFFASGFALVHLWPRSGEVQDTQKAIQAAEYALLGGAIFFVTMLVTVLIGCVVVWIMKGPRYSADSYPIKDSERPK